MTGKSKIKAPADLGSGESPLPGLREALFALYPHVAESEVISAMSPLKRARIILLSALPSNLNHLPQAPAPKTMRLGLRLCRMKCGVRGANLQFIANTKLIVN